MSENFSQVAKYELSTTKMGDFSFLDIFENFSATENVAKVFQMLLDSYEWIF